MEIFDDITPRPVISDVSGDLYDSLQWGSDVKIYAVNNEITSFNFYVLPVFSDGVTLNRNYENEFSSFCARIHYDAGTKLVYTDDGYVIDPTNGCISQ